MKRFRGGLAFKTHRLVYHPTLGLRVIKKKKTRGETGAGFSETRVLGGGMVVLSAGG